MYVSLTALGGDEDEEDDEDEGSNVGTNADRDGDVSPRRRGLLERLWSSAGAVSSSSAGARAYLAASEIAQELVARRLGERAKDDSSSSAGYETVASLTAAMIAGTPRVVLGDARVSETTDAVAAAVAAADAREPLAGARLAAATLVNAARLIARDPTALRRDVESVMEDKPSSMDANRRGGRGSPSRAAAGIPEWLRDAVVETRDERMFRATWAAAGGDGNGDDAPALVRTDDVEDSDWSCYVAEGWRGEGEEGEKSAAANAAASKAARTVVAVFGAAHVDGIVARWNAATRGGVEGSDER